jgi:hypothetical protein
LRGGWTSMTSDQGPVRALPGDWATFNSALQRAYAAGREHQFRASTYVLTSVIKALGGKVCFTIPDHLDGSLMQTSNPDGTFTLEYVEGGSDSDKDAKKDRPKLRQAWSADDPDGIRQGKGNQESQGVNANGEGESA